MLPRLRGGGWLLRPRCSATKRNGEPCGISVEPGVDLCWAHDPANREQRQRITSRAGKSKPSRELAAGVKGQLPEMADRVLAGTLERADAAMTGQLLNIKLLVLETKRKWKKLTEFEETA